MALTLFGQTSVGRPLEVSNMMHILNMLDPDDVLIFAL